jgi:hypothetical protein
MALCLSPWRRKYAATVESAAKMRKMTQTGPPASLGIVRNPPVKAWEYS